MILFSKEGLPKIELSYLEKLIQEVLDLEKLAIFTKRFCWYQQDLKLEFNSYVRDFNLKLKRLEESHPEVYSYIKRIYDQIEDRVKNVEF